MKPMLASLLCNPLLLMLKPNTLQKLNTPNIIQYCTMGISSNLILGGVEYLY